MNPILYTPLCRQLGIALGVAVAVSIDLPAGMIPIVGIVGDDAEIRVRDTGGLQA